MSASVKPLPGENKSRSTGRFSAWAQAVATWSERHDGIVLAILSAWYVALIWNLARRPLWFDELYTFYIAQQPTVARMLQATHVIDLNPPLNYFLTRWSITIFGAKPWATRLPEIAAFWAASLAIFEMLRRRASPLIAATAVALFWSSAYFSYAAEARPYGLVLGFTMILLAAWDRPYTRHRNLRLGIVFASSVLLLLSHVFGALSLGAIWIGEAARSWKRRRIDWAMVAALLLPLVAIVSFLPIFHSFRKSVFPPEAQITWRKLYYLYFAQFRWMLRPLLAIAIIAVFSRKKSSAPQTPWALEEAGTALTMLFLIPLLLTILFMRSHGAFYDRYGIATVLPIVLVVPSLLWWWTKQNVPAAFLGLCAVATFLLLSTVLRAPLNRAAASVLPPRAAAKFTGVFTTSIHGPFRPWWTKLPIPPALAREREHAPLLTSLDGLHPELPLVAGSELTFLEMDQRESPRLVNRLFYLYDRSAELEIAHRTVVDGLLNAAKYFPLRAEIAPYAPFVSEHSQFLVAGLYENPGNWLLRKLQQDGASLQIIARDDSYFDSDIYLVTFPASAQDKGGAGAPPSTLR